MNMDRRLIAALAVPLLLVQAAQTFAAESGPEAVAAGGEDVEELVVTGRLPVWDLMFNFISEIGDPTSHNFGFARWRRNVCVSVHNLVDTAAAQYIADRISGIALELGLRPGEPGCIPNIQIAFATDGRAMADELVKTQPSWFRPFFGTGGTTQGLDALDEFTTSDAPVRWWQLTMPVSRTGEPAISLPGRGPVSVAGSNSRVTHSIDVHLVNCYLIVDITRAGSASWNELADYLAMVALAQIAPNRPPSGYDSILNLFSARSGTSGLTQIDLAYLGALYKLDGFRMPNRQRSVLASTMARVQEPE